MADERVRPLLVMWDGDVRRKALGYGVFMVRMHELASRVIADAPDSIGQTSRFTCSNGSATQFANPLRNTWTSTTGTSRLADRAGSRLT